MSNWIKYKDGVGKVNSLFRSREDVFHQIGRGLVFLLQKTVDRHAEFTFTNDGTPIIFEVESGLQIYGLRIKKNFHPLYFVVIEPSTENDRAYLELIAR